MGSKSPAEDLKMWSSCVKLIYNRKEGVKKILTLMSRSLLVINKQTLTVSGWFDSWVDSRKENQYA